MKPRTVFICGILLVIGLGVLAWRTDRGPEHYTVLVLGLVLALYGLDIRRCGEYRGMKRETHGDVVAFAMWAHVVVGILFTLMGLTGLLSRFFR